VLLKKDAAQQGAFSKLLGGIEIELVQSRSFDAKKIRRNCYWGDPGFIHLCFDVVDMNSLKRFAKSLSFTFTVDSETSFRMDTSGGRFCYVEDPDGSLIELVETHKIPVIKKIGWYLNLKARKKKGPLPSWMVRCLGLSKVR
jgi:hypothetical protein